jgi:hypothetical protein
MAPAPPPSTPLAPLPPQATLAPQAAAPGAIADPRTVQAKSDPRDTNPAAPGVQLAQSTAGPVVTVAAQAAAGQDAAADGASDHAPGDDQGQAQGASSDLKGADPSNQGSTPVAFQPALAPPPASARVAATVQTVSRLAAGIIQNLRAKVARFQLALEPAGLGRVDVNVRIGSDGAVSAALAFDNAASAEALKSRAGELKAALEQAGFNVTGQDLSFTAGGFDQPADGGQGGQRPSPSAFTAVADAADAAAQPPLPGAASASGGLDIRI